MIIAALLALGAVPAWCAPVLLRPIALPSAFSARLPAPGAALAADPRLPAAPALPSALLLPAASAPVLVPAAPAAAAEDGTAAFKRAQKSVRSGRAGRLPPAARVHRYLFVPGFSWDALPDYFGPNVRRLRALGLQADVVETDPLGTPAANAEAVRRAVAASDMSVVLIGHSKGGLDSLKALEMHPGLQAKVAKLVALQTPYHGNALADWMLSRPWLSRAAMVASRLLNLRRVLNTSPFFRRETVAELGTERRRRAVAEAAALSPSIQVYSVVTRVSGETAMRTLMWLTSGVVRGLTGLHNDGLVAPEEGVVPGSRYALLEHVGHVDTVAERIDWRRTALGARTHDGRFAADFTEAMVRWLFARRSAR